MEVARLRVASCGDETTRLYVRCRMTPLLLQSYHLLSKRS
jgi:hypothetical protein